MTTAPRNPASPLDRASRQRAARGAGTLGLWTAIALASSLAWPGAGALALDRAGPERGARPAPVFVVQTYTIQDDATGGDCAQIGTWDAATRTCTLSGDLTGGIAIRSDSTTLDGGGHTLSGDDDGIGVVFSGVAGATVRRLTVSHFQFGIGFREYSSGNMGSSSSGDTVEDVVVSHNEYGVDVGDMGSPGNTLRRVEAFSNTWGLNAYLGSNALHIVDCDAHDNDTGIQIGFSQGWLFEGNTLHRNANGIIIDTAQEGIIRDCEIDSNRVVGIAFGGWGPSYNLITGNRLRANGEGFSLDCAAEGNTIRDNVVSGNQTGVHITKNTSAANFNNKFFRNDFVNTVNAVVEEDGYPNSWDNGLPDGGNYWSDFCTEPQGCVDGNVDGFCDAPYVLTGGQDHYPRTARVHPEVENHPPDCAMAAASISEIWPPDHRLVPVQVVGVTDADGDPVSITVTAVTQDEPVAGEGDDGGPDAAIDNGVVRVRAERDGGGNGRVYSIAFTASDGKGGSCNGSVEVCVPHDMGRGHGCVQDALAENSLGPRERRAMRAGAEGASGLYVAVRHLTRARLVLEYSLPQAGDVALTVFDVAGRRVATLENARRSAGPHEVGWDVTGVARGVYFCRLSLGRESVSRTVVLR
jgi:parallel beta-helix repeat protein